VKDFTLHDASWCEKNRIDLHLQTEIVQIDPQKKIALTSKGAKFSYDQLLLACGGKSFVPPIPGSTSPESSLCGPLKTRMPSARSCKGRGKLW